MRTVIVYESMYGNTRQIAEEIGLGLVAHDVTVVAAHDVTPEQITSADLVVLGAPTHAHSLPRPSTRQGAVDQAAELVLEPDATDEGVRELMGSLPDGAGRLAVAFDTRVDIPAMLSGRASKAIAKELRHHGYRLLVEPESFLVDRHNHLLEGELDRACVWGGSLSVRLADATADSGPRS
jgi:hypothetical protein